MRKILVCGDSFAADWTPRTSVKGWPDMLRDHFDVTNVAQAGCSEYKIYLQLKSVDLTQYDAIIIAHTSPNRLYVKEHPVHEKGSLHEHSDFIYTDIKEHSKHTKSLLPVVDYFERYFDLEYATFVHSLICKEIDNMLLDYSGTIIHVTGFDWDNLHPFTDIITFEPLAKYNMGLPNHLDDGGNTFVYMTLVHRLGL